VCQLGSASVITAFIKPDSPQRDTYIEYVQTMEENHPELQAFVIILSGPDEKLTQELRDLASREENPIKVPLTVLDPEVGLPDSIPINPDADVTILLYRGRHFEKIFEISPDSPTKTMTFTGGTLPQVETLSDEPGFLSDGSDASAELMALDIAAAQMIERP
jgi:hypothetical protein